LLLSKHGVKVKLFQIVLPISVMVLELSDELAAAGPGLSFQEITVRFAPLVLAIIETPYESSSSVYDRIYVESDDGVVEVA